MHRSAALSLSVAALLFFALPVSAFAQTPDIGRGQGAASGRKGGDGKGEQQRPRKSEGAKRDPRDAARNERARKDFELVQKNPLHFYIAKGDADICGAGCDTWIAAEGAFDLHAANRFRAFVEKSGHRGLPVYFHSQGGSLAEAIKVGRIMRAREMVAGVGRTVPAGCDPAREKDEACEAIKRQGRVLTADLRSTRTVCNSACVFALIGAVERRVPPGARLGVHAALGARTDADGNVTARDDAELAPLFERVRQYVVKMGIDTRLFDAAAEIPHERLRYLSRDEIAQFGIDPRPFQESRWTIDEGPPGPYAVLKYVSEATGRDGKEYRTRLLRLNCGKADLLRVQFSRELSSRDGGVSVPISLIGAGGELVFPAQRGKPVAGYNGVSIDDRMMWARAQFFDAAVSGETIDIVETADQPAAQRPKVTTISTRGLAASLSLLRRHCP
jgi:hypothetical protein